MSRGIRTRSYSLQIVPLYALIDSKATHSIIAQGVIKRLELLPERVDHDIRVELPDGKSVLTDEVLTGEKVFISGRNGVRLIVFEMPNFDVILGMDFLSLYGANIDCRNKKVGFNLENGDSFNFGEGHQGVR